MSRAALFLAITLLAGGVPAAAVPDTTVSEIPPPPPPPRQKLPPRPVTGVTYEFDMDQQTWTRRDCTTNTKGTPRSPETETVCYKKAIKAPPRGIGKPRLAP